MNDRGALLAHLERTARGVLSAALGRTRRYALVDFPDHGNVGDSAIWLGELAALDAVGPGDPAYICDMETYSARELRRRTGDGTILIHGGGNLGDLWPRHQEFRERIIADHRDQPIVQLPQSICFSDATNRARARRVFDAHQDLTILVRDSRSLELAREHFAAPAVLCPDLALCLPPRHRPTDPVRPIQWILRDDVETAGHRADAREGFAGGGASGQVSPVDWIDDTEPGASRHARRMKTLVAAAGPVSGRLEPLLWRAWRAAADERVDRGAALLSEGVVVVSDRLHTHILCLLLDIPHVILPDRHHKIASFLDTWSGACDLVTVAADVAEAREAAERLLESGVR